MKPWWRLCAAGAAAFGLASVPAAAAQRNPPPDSIPAEDLETTTPIKHFVTVMQENHSFDNYFATYPGAEGRPDDVCMPREVANPAAGCVESTHIGGQAIIDLGHSTEVFDAQYASGQMNGFVEAFSNAPPSVGEQVMGYYDDRDLPFYWNIADNYVLFDRFFTSAFGGSVRNHFYWISGSPGNYQQDALRPEGFDEVDTIFDSLQSSGVSWKFYVENYDPAITFRADVEGSQAGQLVWVPILNYNRFLDRPELNSRIVPLEQFYDDVATGNLPAVSYIVPSGASEHPPGSIQAGQRFIRSLITEIMRSSAWQSTAFMWTYDDWGGWYDHVPPPKVDEFGYGFRAPALLVSAYAKKGHIDSTTLDFTSMLKFIETNWNIEPLTARDAAANNILTAFDFESAPRAPVLLTTERGVITPERPRTKTVYVAYGGVAALSALLAIAALAVGLRTRTRADTSLDLPSSSR